jgi:hypothetical protein
MTYFRAGLLVIVALLAANFTLVIGRHTGRWDASDFFCPYFMLVAEHARHGEVLLWTPLVEGGCPAGFDPEIGALSPMTVGIAALLGPSECGFRIYWLIIWGLGGLGVVCLARHLRAPPWAAAVTAIGYMFSAAFVNQAEYTAYLVAMSLLPWTLWRLDVALTQWRFLPAAQAGALWGLAALSGYPALVIIGGCWLGGWAGGRLLVSPLLVPTEGWSGEGTGIAGFPKTLLALALCGVVALVVLSPAYLGFFYELRGYSDRGGELPRDHAVAANALDPKALATFANPYVAILGDPKAKNLWPTDIAMSSIYLAPMVMVLGLGALWLRPRDAFRWWLAGMAVLCLTAAMGDTLPLRGWLYDLLPPMRYFRHSAMFRCLYLFTVVVLAIMAGRDLNEAAAEAQLASWKKLATISLLAAVGALAALAVVFKAAHLDKHDVPTAALAATHAAAVWIGTLVLALLVCRSLRGPHVLAFQRSLLALVIIDAVLTIALSKPAMYTNRREVWPAVEAAQVHSLDMTVDGLTRLPSWTVGTETQMNACLVGKVPVLRCFNVLRNQLYDATVEDRVLGGAALGSKRIWFSPQASVEPLDRDAFRQLAARAAALGQPCIVVSAPEKVSELLNRPKQRPSPPFLTSLSQLPAATQMPVHVGRYDGRRLEFDATCPSDGWLLVTDRWAPGWRAWVNDVPQPVWIGNMVFRAVPVVRGENHVRFFYSPFGYPALLIGSWLALGLVSAASLPMIFRCRPSQ